MGVGGLDGLSSGIVSSTTAASKVINWGLTITIGPVKLS